MSKGYSSDWLKLVKLPPESLIASGSASGCTVNSFTGGSSNSCSYTIPCTVPFTADAQFYYECGDCEYRQYVMGYFAVQLPGVPWITLTHYVWNAVLNSGAYEEDACGGGYAPYGHRAGPSGCTESYSNPNDPLTACDYQASDAPGFNAMWSDTNYTFDLSFAGEIIGSMVPLPPEYWNCTGFGYNP